MTATLTTEPIAGGSLIVVDCAHGTTQVSLVNGQATGITEVHAAALALARHYDAERCRCTRSLRRRYGVAS